MGETPEILAAGRGEYAQSLLGHRITDLTGSTAASGSVPYINTDGTLAETSAMNYSEANTRLTVTGLGATTIVIGESADPGVATENTATIYLENVSGSSVLKVRFNASDSQAQTIATEQ